MTYVLLKIYYLLSTNVNIKKLIYLTKLIIYKTDENCYNKFITADEAVSTN